MDERETYTLIYSLSLGLSWRLLSRQNRRLNEYEEPRIVYLPLQDLMSLVSAAFQLAQKKISSETCLVFVDDSCFEIKENKNLRHGVVEPNPL